MSEALHATTEYVANHVTDDVLAATINGLLYGYDQRWRHTMAGKQIVMMEQTLTAPLVNVQTQRSSRSFRIAGKLDKLVKQDGQLVLYDHKTTSSSIQDPSDVYWRQLQVDSQHQHYELLCWLHGIRPSMIVWDVIRKPGIRPKQLTKKAKQRIVAVGDYCGSRVADAIRNDAANMEREDATLYYYRLCEEVTANADKYYARRSVAKSQPEFLEYCEELWEVAQSMLLARRNDTHYRNSAACIQYGRPCPYLGVCSGHDRADSDNWKPKADKHSELGGLPTGHDYITNSRLKSFLTCRRKHYYDYEAAIERIDEEERDALYFGTVFHAALDVYWQQFCRNGEPDNGHDNHAVAGSESATVH